MFSYLCLDESSVCISEARSTYGEPEVHDYKYWCTRLTSSVWINLSVLMLNILTLSKHDTLNVFFKCALTVV